MCGQFTKSGLLLSGVLLLSLVLISCAQSPDSGDKLQGTSELANENLIVYSGRSESLIGPIIETFERLTGIEVAVRYGNTAGVASTILEEGDNTPADVFYAQDPAGLGAIAHLFRPLPDEILNRVDPAFRSVSGTWVGVTGRARVVAYNTDAVNEDELPMDIKGFVDHKWKNRIGWAPTNGSFQTMVTAMRVVWGEEETGRWLSGIMNNEPKEYPKNTQIIGAIGTGEIQVGFVNYYYLHRFLALEGPGFPVRNYFLPGEGPDSLLLVSGIGILETTESGSAAEKFVGFMLSTLAQNYFAKETYEYPLIDGVELHSLLSPLSELRLPEIDITDMDDLGETLQLMRDAGALP